MMAVAQRQTGRVVLIVLIIGKIDHTQDSAVRDGRIEFGGGRGGRTDAAPTPPLTYRLDVPEVADNASIAGAHCPILPDGRPLPSISLLLTKALETLYQKLVQLEVMGCGVSFEVAPKGARDPKV
jgi:hypothetical protein